MSTGLRPLTAAVFVVLVVSTGCSLFKSDVEAPSPQATKVAALNGTVPHAEEVVKTQASQELSTVEVVKQIKPSVVHIATQVLLMGMFNQPVPQQGVGTSVILDDRGHILTNNHVVAGAERIVVTLQSGVSFPARLVGLDPTTDTAVVQIDAPDLTPAKLGSSSELEVGEDVFAIGHALGLRGGPTVSKGVVSALGRSIESDRQVTLVDLVQTDASINPGNSGGPLVNSRAEVIAINTAIFQDSQGIGFAINIDDVALGVVPINYSPALSAQFGVPAPEELQDGVVIT